MSSDHESESQIQDLVYENMELQTKVEKWRLRARTLQEERWGFVQKWRADTNSAKEAATAAAKAAVAEETAKISAAPAAGEISSLLAKTKLGGDDSDDEDGISKKRASGSFRDSERSSDSEGSDEAEDDDSDDTW